MNGLSLPFLCLLLICCLGLQTGRAMADVEPPTPGQSTDKTDHPTDERTLNELRDKRAKANSELEAVSKPQILATGAPTGTPEDELHERQTLLLQIVRSIDEQIDDTLRLGQTRQHRAEFTHSLGDSKEPAEQPPYSIFFADQLWDSIFSLRLAVESRQAQLSLVELRFDRARESLLVADERLRHSSELVENAKGTVGVSRQSWLRDLDSLRQRASAAILQAAQLSKTRIQEQLADARAELEAAEQKLQTVERQVEFSEKDLASIRTRLSQERQGLAGELEQTTLARHRQFDQLRSVEQQLAVRLAARGDKPRDHKTSDALRRAQEAVEIERIRADNLALKSDLLQVRLDVVEGERQLWESRFSLMHSPQPGQARAAYERFTPLFTNFLSSRDYLRQQISIVSGQIGELETRAKRRSSGNAKALLDAHRQREAIYAHALERVDQTARFLERWKSAFKEQRKELPLSARIADWRQHTWDRVKAAWNLEVFSAEDTIEVDGKKVTGHRSVTVGKIVSALLFLLAGYWLCLYLAGLMGRLAVRRLGVTPELANLLRQWSQAFLLTVLMVMSLVWAKIPLTIFAFLGGAFAIGVGFGAQNLLKNVISGVLLLVERPLRVGDLIEVDNVRGRVTTIGLRSSTVRDAKGVVTLIPNSSFLERHLTNWTYSSRIGRFSLRVGAPYGSSSQLVMDLLSGLAAEHARILKAPPPQVLLDEFGNQARIFTLNYWLEIRLDVDPHEVASELRFAIEQKFGEAGLKILPAA